MVQNHILGSGKWFGTDLDHTGCIRSHFDDKKCFDFFFFNFFHKILRHFGLFLKGLDQKIHKKSIFLKSKLDYLDMKNRIDQKLYLVNIFASLAWFVQNSKTERQVRF